MERFPGRVIEPGRQGDFEVWDLLGANWWYCRKRGVSKLVMCDYVTKLAEKYEVTKKAPSPNIDEFDLVTQENEVSTNIREVVGGLQWVVTICRPDVARSVNALSRSTAQKRTMSRLAAGKHITAYLPISA